MIQIPIQPIDSLAEKTFGDKDLKGKICLSPFVQIAISGGGKVRLCGCYDWMPQNIGNLYENKIEDLLASPTAQKIRQSIIDGTYSYCNEKTCNLIRNDLLNTTDTLPDSVKWQIEDSSRYSIPREITIAGDITCNLSCPSCRTRVYKIGKEEEQKQASLSKSLRENLFSNPTDREINITLSTSGELFASPFLLDFLEGISVKDFPNLGLRIQTNGLLAQKNWYKIQHFEHNIRQITVTIDASEKETYEKLRRGGRWKDIQAAMLWLQKKKKEIGTNLYTRMVIQKDNFRQMEDFYHMSKKFDADKVEYSRISDWKTMTPEEFFEVDVLNPDNQYYNEAKEMYERVNSFSDTLIYG